MLNEAEIAKVNDILRHVAGTEIMPRFRNLQKEDIREKARNDFVTVADEESERALTRLLTEAFPGTVVVGEESVSRDLSVLDLLKGDKPVWVIDPIDGTANFMRGDETFGILLALVQGGETQCGWAFDVPRGRMAFAQRGKGATLGGEKLEISCGKAEVADLVIQGGGAGPGKFAKLKSLVAGVEVLRCSLHDNLFFYTGKSDCIIHLNEKKPWDHAAANLIAEEAGGYVAMSDGSPYKPTFWGKEVMISAPNKAWWERLAPFFADNLL